MATIYWTGGATPVSQVDTGSIDSLDGTPANNTFTITVGDDSVSTPGNSTVSQTAIDLVALAEAATGDHMSQVTWANPASGNITATADTAGVSFVAALTETGAGTGAVTDFAETTANAGPSSLKSVDNYSGGALPGSSDTLVFADSSDAIAYDLDALGNVAQVVQDMSFTGLIGLRSDGFATGADGGTVVTTSREYRPSYLKGIFASEVIGGHTGTGSPPGSPRVKIHNTSTAAATIEVINSASSGSEDYRPAVLLLADHANVDLIVRASPGGVGLAADRPDETATVGNINVVGANADFTLGSGATYGNLTQSAGAVRIEGAAATVTAIAVTGGTMIAEGDFTTTALTVDGGTVTDNHIKTGGDATTTATVRGGTWNLQDTDAARTIGSVVHTGGQIQDNPAVVFTAHTRARGTIIA